MTKNFFIVVLFTTTFVNCMNYDLEPACPISAIAHLALEINKKNELNKISKTGHELTKINKIIDNNGGYLICNDYEHILLAQDLSIINDITNQEMDKILKMASYSNGLQLHVVVAHMQVENIFYNLNKIYNRAVKLSNDRFTSVLLGISDYYSTDKFFNLKSHLSLINELQLQAAECNYIISILNYIRTKHNDEQAQKTLDDAIIQIRGKAMPRFVQAGRYILRLKN